MESTSDNKQGLLEEKLPENMVCGVNLKKGYSMKNLLALFWINFMVVSIAGYTNV